MWRESLGEGAYHFSVHLKIYQNKKQNEWAKKKMWWKCVATCAGKWMWWGGRRGCVFTPREMHLLLGGYCDCWWTAILLMIGSIMYGCERWIIKKTERWRTDAFKLVLEKILESPLDWKERKPVNLKWNQPRILIGRTDAEAEAPILWPPDAKSQHLGRTLMLETTEGRRRRGQQRMRELDGITYSMDMSFSKLRDIVKRQGSMACGSP